MADQDGNGYSDEASDFKRKNTNNKNMSQDDQDMDDEQENHQQSQKAQEYIKAMMVERMDLDKKYPIADRLLEVEIESVQKTGKPPARRYVDIYREKHIKVSVKVLVPVREHPRFNFVGKLLGPKGNTLKRLQEDTMCRMAILGRGSMKDRKKEEELRNGLDTKYAHLCDDLHVEVTANGPPAEVHARIAYAMAELRKYLIPDSNDFIRQEQMRELMEDAESNENGPAKKFYKKPNFDSPGGPIMSGAPQMGPSARPVPSQKKVLSILDKARAAMEEHHTPRAPPAPRYDETGYEHAYEPPYAYHQPAPIPPRAKYAPEASEYEPEYRREYYREPAPYSVAGKPQAPLSSPVNPTGRPWKPPGYGVGATPPSQRVHPGLHADNGAPSIKHGLREAVQRYRHVPYSRPMK